jgi:N-methylhydantoinase B
MTGGGGGFGDASKRDPEAVRRDVRNGDLSAAAAHERYGVDV